LTEKHFITAIGLKFFDGLAILFDR
jgi:hypothetical protein